MRSEECHIGNSKIRSDKGIGKVGVKTLFFILILFQVLTILFIFFKKPCISVESKEIVREIIKRDTIYYPEILEVEKLVYKEKPKVNYSASELEALGYKTTENICLPIFSNKSTCK